MHNPMILIFFLGKISSRGEQMGQTNVEINRLLVLTVHLVLLFSS